MAHRPGECFPLAALFDLSPASITCRVHQPDVLAPPPEARGTHQWHICCRCRVFFADLIRRVDRLVDISDGPRVLSVGRTVFAGSVCSPSGLRGAFFTDLGDLA